MRRHDEWARSSIMHARRREWDAAGFCILIKSQGGGVEERTLERLISSQRDYYSRHRTLGKRSVLRDEGQALFHDALVACVRMSEHCPTPPCLDDPAVVDGGW